MGIARYLAIAALASVSTVARADVDWAAGQVTAQGLGIADRHAPTPAAAREPARRAAEDAARAALTAQLPALPLAGGGTLRGKLGEPAVKQRVERAIAEASAIRSTPQTDGSWNVTLALPIEAVRQALAGQRPFTRSDGDLAVVIVEGVASPPAIGVTVDGIAVATLWVTKPPAWAGDAPRVKALASSQPGAIELASKHGGPATLFVITR